MNAFEKILEKLDDLYTYYDNDANTSTGETLLSKKEVVDVVNEVAEEYNNRVTCKDCKYYDFGDKHKPKDKHSFVKTWNHKCLMGNANHFSSDTACKKYKKDCEECESK